MVSDPEEEVLVISASGMVLRTQVGAISQIGRQTQGVIVMRIAPDDQIVAIAPVAALEEEGDAKEESVTTIGWVGVWLLVGSFVLMLAEGVLVAVWGLAVARRTRTLAELAQNEQGLIEADVKKLRTALDETQRLWRPYQRVLRWLRHPLVIALLQSYARRRVRLR